MKMPPEADRTVGLDEKAAEGGYPSAARIGYQNVDDDIGITPHHQRAPTIDQDFWQERTTAWQHERDELRAELSRNEQVIPHEEFLAAARHPIELLQRAPDLYVTQEPSEKAGLLKTLVSNYTVTDGSLTVTLRSPFDLLAQGGKSKDWWS